jgi:AbrB family looped-hinge helix DNA binding protein
MTKANTQSETGIMAIIRVICGGQVTLPADARRAFNLKEGDYLEAEVTERGVLLKPITVVDQSKADRELEAILSRVKYVGPEPRPSEDEVTEMVNREIQAYRAHHATDGAR